jgi:hypothetical protein
MVTEGTLLDLGGAVYNVAHSAFGAKGDVKFAGGVAMTAGSPTLTATSNPFVSSDVGKVVWVPGAGASGRTLGGTITAFTNAGQVTLSASAGTSVTGKTIGFGTDDTAAIQAATDAASAAGGGKVVCRGGKTYLVTELYLRPGVDLNLNGATLIRPANQHKFGRMIQAAGATGTALWSGSVDSAPITVRNGTLDGNRPNQGPYVNYELEHQHLLFFAGSPAAAGRLRVNLERLVLRDCVADGISLYHNVDAQICSVRAVDCWRGGLVATGGYSRIQVVDLTSGGYVHPSGIDIEVDEGSEAAGFGGSKVLDVQMTNILLEGDFDAGILGGTFVGSNIVSTGQGFILGGHESVVRISNSSFLIGAEGSYVVWPKDVVFDNVTFTMEPAATNPATPFKLFLWVRMRAGLTPANQKCVFRGCTWKSGPSVKASDVLHAIVYGEDALSLNNELVVEGGEIPAGFDYGIDAEYGMRATLKGLRNRAARPIRWTADEGGAGLDLTVSDMDVRGAGFYMEMGDGYPGSGIKRIEHRNVYMDEADSGISSGGGAHATTYVGGRVIRVTSSPAGRLAGLPGDVAELETPAAGQTWRWVCLSTGTVPDAANTTWKAEAPLAP